MKKLFAILAITGFVACSDSNNNSGNADSSKMESQQPAADTANKMMADTAKNMVDTAKKDVKMMADTTKKATDKMTDKKMEEKKK